MKKILGKIILKLIGWKLDKTAIPEKGKSYVIIVAPHTSNLDAMIGIPAYWATGLKMKFLIKDFYTKGLLGIFFKFIGAIGVNRKKQNDLVNTIKNFIQMKKGINIAITPEGTRSHTKKWKKGFYHIAKGLNVPICLGYIDFKKKKLGFGKIIEFTDDIESDFRKIEKFYKTVNAKYPKKFNYKIS